MYNIMNITEAVLDCVEAAVKRLVTVQGKTPEEADVIVKSNFHRLNNDSSAVITVEALCADLK